MSSVLPPLEYGLSCIDRIDGLTICCCLKECSEVVFVHLNCTLTMLVRMTKAKKPVTIRFMMLKKISEKPFVGCDAG